MSAGRGRGSARGRGGHGGGGGADGRAGSAKGKVYAPELTFSLCDYPGEPSCVVFFSGCNFDCGYCQNWRLKKQSPDQLADLREIEEALRRNTLITACKVSGGEPLLQPKALAELASCARSLGLKFGVDTNGSRPTELGSLIPILDLVSVDVKTKLDDREYRRITGVSLPRAEDVRKTLATVIASGAYADLRMVVIPGYNDTRDVAESIGGDLRSMGYIEKAGKGGASFTLVEFVPENAEGEGFRKLSPPPVERLKQIACWLGIPRVMIRHRSLGFMVPA